MTHRYIASVMSNLLFAGLVWASAAAYRYQFQTVDHISRPLDPLEIALIVSGASNVLDEANELMTETHTVLKENPNMKRPAAVVRGFSRYLKADSWNLIDLVSSIMFVMMLGFRLNHRWWQYQVRRLSALGVSRPMCTLWHAHLVLAYGVAGVFTSTVKEVVLNIVMVAVLLACDCRM